MEEKEIQKQDYKNVKGEKSEMRDDKGPAEQTFIKGMVFQGTKLKKMRRKNPFFWLGLVGIVFTAAGVDFNTLTSWDLLLQALLSIIKNPVAIASVIAAVLGVFVDPTTPGLKDNK
ncbi:MAG: phage holin [Clostridium sp.]